MLTTAYILPTCASHRYLSNLDSASIHTNLKPIVNRDKDENEGGENDLGTYVWSLYGRYMGVGTKTCKIGAIRFQ